MTTIPVDHKPPKVRIGYEGHELTKPPDWHDLVALDLLLNNLTTGLFLVAASAELAAPSAFGPAARLAYLVALPLLLMDLACLVFDLGSPTRFHHMLRVFKPSSPMSLGTWSLTAYSLPLTLIVGVDLAQDFGWLADSGGVALLRKAILALGLLPAFGSAAYKGVLFSTSSQPGWKDSRWLGGYLVNSALMFGAVGLLALASFAGPAGGVDRLRPAALLLIASNLVPLGLVAARMRPALEQVEGAGRLAWLAGWVVGIGLIAPAALLWLGRGPVAGLAASAGLVVGGYAWRRAIVFLPHQVQRGPATDPS